MLIIYCKNPEKYLNLSYIYIFHRNCPLKDSFINVNKLIKIYIFLIKRFHYFRMAITDTTITEPIMIVSPRAFNHKGHIKNEEEKNGPFQSESRYPEPIFK